MAPVGRPSSRTNQGAKTPTRELGVPGLGYGPAVGSPFSPLVGGNGPWRMYTDEWEYVPELRWPYNVRLLDQMRTDSQLAGLLTAVMWGICQLRFVVDPNGARDELVKEVSEDLNLPIMGKDGQPRGRMKGKFTHSKFVTQAMLSAIYGHMYFNQVGTIVDGKWRLRKLAPRMPQTISQINVAEDGGLVSVVQYPPANYQYSGNGIYGGPEIPVDNLVAFVFNQEGMSWTGRSMMRDCYRDWLIKDRDLRIEAINHERAGGVPYATAPQGATVDEISDLDQMMRQFRIGEAAGGALPFGSELHIAKGSGSDIDRTIKRLDESMARRFLLQLVNLAQGGQHVGSYSLSETFEDFFLVGQRQIAQWYCDTVTEHVIEDIVDWNYGEDEELAPRITWERTSEDSLGVDQLSLLVQHGVIIMDDELENVVRYRNMLPKRTTPRPELDVTVGGPRQPTEQQGKNESPGGQPASSGGVTPTKTPAKTSASAGESAAPSEDPADIRASFMDRVFRRKPDVMASGPVLVTVPNVAILEAGVQYQLSSGPATFTPEDLADAVTAANEDPSIPSPRLKLGHIDPRYNDTTTYDATPSFGKATNLRLSDNGMTIYADYVGVPKWLAEILPSAYPSRSVEGFWGMASQTGKTWKFVLSACALLGVVWPGINQLDDLPALAAMYGDEMPADVQVLGVEASGSQPGGDPMTVVASANLDDVRRAFYNDYVPAHANEGALWWWVRAVLTDPNELVVEDDETGQLYKLPFSSDDRAAVSFGDSEPVRIDYVPDDRESLKAAASHVAATLAIGRKVLASWDTRSESAPETTQGGTMDPKEIRTRLGLAEDASDEQVKDAIRALNTAAGMGETPGDGDGGEGDGGEGEGEGSGEAAPASEAQPAAVAATQLPPGTVLVDKDTWESVQAGARTALDLKAQGDKTNREQAVAAAISDGRIPPARKDHWLNYLEKDPGGFEVLASLETVVPVSERGHGHAPDSGAQVELEQETVAGWTETLFPEVRRQRADDAAAASGGAPRRSRIVTDAHYKR